MNAITYILVEIINIALVVGLIIFFQENKPLGRMSIDDNPVKRVIAFLIFTVLHGLFSMRFVYFTYLIVLEFV